MEPLGEVYINDLKGLFDSNCIDVYNNLNKLYRDRLINKISVEGMPDRYDRIVKHDHIVCQNCGKLTDIQFEDLTETLKKQFGADFLSYDLKVFYVCPDCRKKFGSDKNIHGYKDRGTVLLSQNSKLK